MVRAANDSSLAADDLPDFYIYLRICLDMGKGGELVSGAAFSFLRFYDITDYTDCNPFGNHMVRHIEFYGVCRLADVTASKAAQTCSAGFRVGKQCFFVYFL